MCVQCVAQKATLNRHSTYIIALYFCVLWMLEIIDDQCRDPSVEEKDHLAGQNYYEPNAPLKYDERVVQSAKGVTGKGDTLNFNPQKHYLFAHFGLNS